MFRSNALFQWFIAGIAIAHSPVAFGCAWYLENHEPPPFGAANMLVAWSQRMNGPQTEAKLRAQEVHASIEKQKGSLLVRRDWSTAPNLSSSFATYRVSNGQIRLLSVAEARSFDLTGIPGAKNHILTAMEVMELDQDANADPVSWPANNWFSGSAKPRIRLVVSIVRYTPGQALLSSPHITLSTTTPQVCGVAEEVLVANGSLLKLEQPGFLKLLDAGLEVTAEKNATSFLSGVSNFLKRKAQADRARESLAIDER